METIQSVTWSHNGKYIAFIGQNKKQSDIYIYNFETQELTNLTDDIFSDSDPSWSLDDSKIYFASDRGSLLDKSQIQTISKFTNMIILKQIFTVCLVR